MTAYEQIENRIELLHRDIKSCIDNKKMEMAAIWAYHILALNEKKQIMSVEEAGRMV